MPKSTVKTPKGTRPVRFALREVREAIGITQYELAKRLGVPRSTVCRMEGGSIGKINLRVMASCVAILNEESNGAVVPGDLFRFVDVGEHES